MARPGSVRAGAFRPGEAPDSSVRVGLLSLTLTQYPASVATGATGAASLLSLSLTQYSATGLGNIVADVARLGLTLTQYPAAGITLDERAVVSRLTFNLTLHPAFSGNPTPGSVALSDESVEHVEVSDESYFHVEVSDE